MAEEYDYLFKSIVVGDGGVGKTALTLRFSKGFFTEDYKMTIGVDFHVKTISIDTDEGPIRCKLQLWDTGGQERFSSIRPMYYRGSLGVVLVYDVTNSASFEHLPQWIEEVRANIKAEVPILLVGNKSDLADQRAVSIDELNDFTRDFNLYYMETSAKTGDGVGDCFYILACLMIGSDVPDQLIKNNTVFNPGQIFIEAPSISQIPSLKPEIEFEYSAPPVPEPLTESEPGFEYEAPPVPEPLIETKPEFEYEAPPVPEPLTESEPEFEYEAPPVPDAPVIKETEPLPTFEQESEPEIPIPEPKEIEFKTPDEILSQKSDKVTSIPSFIPPQDSYDSLSKEAYKPKAIPFSKSTPIPAPPPQEFRSEGVEKSIETTSSATPFRVVKKEEPIKPKPASMTFKTEPEPISNSSESPFFLQPSSAQQSGTKSDSLVDYMPQTILSKKEKKKQKKAKEKKKKKKAKEKEEKIEPSEISEKPSLFQALTQRFEEIEPKETSPFIPFLGTKESKTEESSTLRIIPNVDEIKNEPSNFTVITSTPPEKELKSKSKDLIICEQCGAILSSDYAFCNKCGNKL
ncbi:MAG: GTP-binding protein [Promethearchaeota archaeon]